MEEIIIVMIFFISSLASLIMMKTKEKLIVFHISCIELVCRDTLVIKTHRMLRLKIHPSKYAGYICIYTAITPYTFHSLFPFSV